ncbi:MAG: hypothetical protein U0T56_06765 [Ferruginibacter sp.]
MQPLSHLSFGGFFRTPFARFFPISFGQDPAMVNLMHADGAGTKSIRLTLYWKETGDISVEKASHRMPL